VQLAHTSQRTWTPGGTTTPPVIVGVVLWGCVRRNAHQDTAIPLRKPPNSAASVALVERPEGNQWILLAPWGRRYLRAWRAFEHGEDKKPLLADFRPKISQGGGTITSTQRAARSPLRRSTS
jgi:hypothetical protein